MNTDNPLLPYVSPELMRFLNATHPVELPNIDMTDRDIWIKVGERKLIEWLQVLFQLQEEG